MLITHTHTHTRLMALFPGLPWWAGTRKEKPIWILLKQETVSGSGISWAICRSAPSSRQITTPAPHHSVFYRPDALPAAQPTASKHWRPQSITHIQAKYSGQRSVDSEDTVKREKDRWTWSIMLPSLLMKMVTTENMHTIKWENVHTTPELLMLPKKLTKHLATDIIQWRLNSACTHFCQHSISCKPIPLTSLASLARKSPSSP